MKPELRRQLFQEAAAQAIGVEQLATRYIETMLVGTHIQLKDGLSETMQQMALSKGISVNDLLVRYLQMGLLMDGAILK